MALIDKDRYYMNRALALAKRGLYTTRPNPRVGCVIVRDSGVVGEGYHHQAGEPHAEALALRQAGDNARGANAYVTLEPCSHYGKTAPCADALIAAGIKRVVVACGDPNPKINGRGLARLRAAGVDVEVGLLAQQARELNIGFFHRFEQGRPWVRLKMAMSLDGRTALANGESKWITGKEARADVQHWRARSCAILTGSGTALADNPRLTVRLDVPFQPPWRVVLDRQGQVPSHFHVFDDLAPTLLVHDEVRSISSRADETLGIAVEQDKLDLEAVLQQLAERQCNEVQVETGATLGGALFAAGLVDEIMLYIAPVLLGDKARPLMVLPLLSTMQARWPLTLVKQYSLGDDLCLQLRCQRN